MKIFALALGLIVALLTLGYAAYLAFSDPNALPDNAIFLFILIIVALVLIFYGLSRD